MEGCRLNSMEIEYKDLLDNKSKLPDSYKNFLNAFGYVVVKNFLSSKEIEFLKQKYDGIYTKHFNDPWKNIASNTIKTKSVLMIPSFIEKDQELSEFLIEKNILELGESVIGSGAQYWGSDGSLFAHGSRWHRDTATVGRRLKMNVYLSSASAMTGAFRIIPGSHNIGDEFSNHIGRATAWPESAHLGGFSEKGYFPGTISPVSRAKKLYLKSKKQHVPHHTISFDKGDVVLFDDRALHCVYAPVYAKLRRLITILFSEQPQQMKSHISSAINFDPKKIDEETSTLKQLECNQYSCSAYDKDFLQLLDKKGKGRYVSQMRDIHPNLDAGFDNVVRQQGIDLREFLVKNYY